MARRIKSANGKGITSGFSVVFDEQDYSEARAMQASQRLAFNQHGARKRIIVAVLGAMQTHYEQHGRDLTVEEVLAGLIAAASSPYRQAPQQIDGGETVPMKPLIAVGTAQKASATAQAGNLLKGMGGLFGKKR